MGSEWIEGCVVEEGVGCLVGFEGGWLACLLCNGEEGRKDPPHLVSSLLVRFQYL